MTELLDQITEVTEVTRAQIETDRSCTVELKQKLTAEQDRATTAQLQIELSTEMNEQLQLQIADLTTAIEQLRDRPPDHDRKQTDALSVTAVPKTASPQKAAAVKRTVGNPRIQGAPQRSQEWLETERVNRFVEWRTVKHRCFLTRQPPSPCWGTWGISRFTNRHRAAQCPLYFCSRH